MNSSGENYVEIDEYTSVVTDALQVVGAENKDEFIQKYLENGELREKFKLIGTHSEAFHCDEVLATAMLLRTAEYKNAIIVRTRDQEIIDKLDIVCDVGGVFDVEKKRFDHHQKTFTETFVSDKVREAQNPEELKESQEAAAKEVTKLSSAGLIYKFFGKEVLTQIAGEYKKTLNEEQLERLFKKLYKSFIMEMDAVDTGVKCATEMKYETNTDLGRMVGLYNGPWNAP